MCSADFRAAPELQVHIYRVCAVQIAGLCLSCRNTFTGYVQCGLQGCAWAAGAYLPGVCSVDCRAVPGLQAHIYRVCVVWIAGLRWGCRRTFTRCAQCGFQDLEMRQPVPVLPKGWAGVSIKDPGHPSQPGRCPQPSLLSRTAGRASVVFVHQHPGLFGREVVFPYPTQADSV